MANILEGMRKFRNLFKSDFEKRMEKEHREYEESLDKVDTDGSPGNKTPREWSNIMRDNGRGGG